MCLHLCFLFEVVHKSDGQEAGGQLVVDFKYTAPGEEGK